MSQKDLQFIERALVHPWMFWVYFWKWPRIVRQACAEYDLLAKERDAAKAAHERSERANKIVRDWIHVTHRLSTTPEAIRAIFAAGKRLSILLVFFVVTNTYGQAPPYLRNQWTTNADPRAIKVISTNGVHAATNVWELDFTNTATVTVSAVSNANKVMVSFTGSASTGNSSLTNALLHAGPTNGSVAALILTAGTGIDLSTSGTNRVVAVTGELTNWVNIPTNAFASGEFILRSNGFGTNTTFYSQTNFGPVIGQDMLGSNIWQIATNGQIKMGKFVDTIFGPGTDQGIYDIRSKEAGESFFTEWDGGIWEKNDGSGGRSTFKLDADLGNTNANFVRFLMTTRRGGVTRTLSMENGWNASTVELPGTFSWSLNSGDAGGGMFVYSNNASAKTFSVESNGTTRVMGEIGVYPFRDGVVFLPTPTARLQISNAPNFAIPLFRAQTNSSNGVMIESNGLLIAMSGFQLTSGTPGAGKVLTDVAGDGVGTWETASSGSGIASIFTNNVLAGGPGLTELGFTNSATVTWTATTNAGRVTMSATSAGGGSQTPWTSDIDGGGFSLTNVNNLSVTGTITTANGTLLNNMTDSWTNAGTTYESIKMNVLDTASAANSRILELQINTNTQFRFTKDLRFQVFNTNTDDTTFERGGIFWTNNILRVGTEKGSVGGTGRDVYIVTPTKQWTFSEGSGNFASAAGFDCMAFGKYGFVLRSELYSQANGTFTMTGSGAGTFTGLIWSLNTAANPMVKQVLGGHLTITDGTGTASTNSLFFANTVDTTASTGMTMHRQSGRVRLSAGGQTYLLTNTLVTTSAIITATINSDDTTAKSVVAVPTAGLITLKCNAATTANTDISFLISSP